MMAVEEVDGLLLAIINGDAKETTSLLEHLVELSRSPSYRTLLASHHAVPRLLPLLRLDQFASPTVLTRLLKLLRNLCAGEPSNQLSFLQNDGVRSVSLFVAFALESHTFDFPDMQSFIRFSLQLLGNVCGGGEAHKEAVWSRFFPHMFRAVASIGKDDQIIEPLCMVLYSCCRRSQQRLSDLCHGQGAALLSGCLTAIVGNGNLFFFFPGHTYSIEFCLKFVRLTDRKVLFRMGLNFTHLFPKYSHVFFPPHIYCGASGDLYTGSCDWISLLLSELCLQQPLLPHLFINLTRSNAHPLFTTDNSTHLADIKFCREHVILLTYLVELLRGMPNTQESEPLSDSERVSLPLPSALIQFLKDVVEVSSRQLMSKIVDESQLLDMHIIDILQNVLEIFKMFCASEYGFRSSVIDELLSSGLIRLCVELLRDLGPPDLIAKSIERHDEVELTGKKRIRLPRLYRGYRRDIVAILANASYLNRAVQDEIRNLGGLPIILQQCVVDEHNPFLREWGFWAIRNLLYDNLDNIKEIVEMQLKGTVTPTELEESGYKVEMDPLIGRPKLVNISSMK